MRAIILGALILASGAFVGCKREQRPQQGTQQTQQPATQPGAQEGTGGAGPGGATQDRVIPPATNDTGSRPKSQGATGTSPDTGDVQRGAGGEEQQAPNKGPSDEQTSRPRQQPSAAGAIGMAAVTRVQPQQEQAASAQEPQHGGAGLVTEEGAAGDEMEQHQQPHQQNQDDFIDSRQEGIGGSGVKPDESPANGVRIESGVGEAETEVQTGDDTLPHTNPEIREGIGGSGPATQEEGTGEALVNEPQFPQDENAIVFPPLEALKPFSEGQQQGTGGSGMARQQAPLNPVVGQVDARSQDRLVVQDVQHGTYALTLNPNTCISRNGKAISLGELDEGAAIRVKWGLQNGQRVATWVDVLRDAPPKQGPQQGTGGSGVNTGTGTQEEQPLVEPLGNDEFQGH